MIVLLALLLAGPSLPSASQSEMRGLWVVRTGLLSPESVDQVVDGAARGGFNALFVQVRGRGDAFYASRVVERSELLRGQPADFDPLGAPARARPRARPPGACLGERAAHRALRPALAPGPRRHRAIRTG